MNVPTTAPEVPVLPLVPSHEETLLREAVSGIAAGFGPAYIRQKVEAGDVEIDSKVMLLPTEERGFKIAVELDVTLPSIDDEGEAVELVRAAHKVCPYSNATRNNIEVKLTANEAPVEQA